MPFKKRKKNVQEPPTGDWLSDQPSVGGRNPLTKRFETSDETETAFLQENRDQVAEAHATSKISVDGETRIFESRDDRPDSMSNPPAGWLVVVRGPGKGSTLMIGYGMNSIGRNLDQRIPLNFGDERISRENHAQVTYDEKSRKFFVQHGGGPTLTYVGENALLMPRELVRGETVTLGGTSLKFIPLCTEDFDWGDLED